MTREDVIRMAREAGLGQVRLSPALHEMQVDVWMRFAALVAAAERDACAKVCKQKSDEWYARSQRWQHHHGAAIGADLCADAIREREGK